MSVKKPSNGAGVQNVKERKPIVEYLLTSGGMYLYTIIFSIFGVIFIIDQIPGFVKILIGIAFTAPVAIVEFQKGKNAGEKEYKLRNKSILSDIHSQRIIKINLFKSVLHVLPFVVSSVLLTVLGVVLGLTTSQQWLQGAMLMIFIPMTLIFMGAGLLKLDVGFISWFSVLSVAIFVAVVSAAFIAGYIYGVNALKGRSTEIVNEIRNYE